MYSKGKSEDCSLFLVLSNILKSIVKMREAKLIMKNKKIISISILFIGLSFFPYFQKINLQNLNSTQNKLDKIIYSPETSTPYTNNFANLTGHGWEVRKVEFSPDGQVLASASHDGSIKLWDITTGKVLHTLQGHYYDVISLAFSPDGKILASGGWGKKINLWDTSSGELLRTWSIDPHIAMDLAFSPDGSSLAVGSGDWGGNWVQPEQNTLKLLNVTNGDILQNFTGHNNAVTSVLFSKDGTMLVSGSWDATVKLWNLTNGNEIRSFNNHTWIISSIALSPDGSTLASGSYDKTIKVWDINSGGLLQNISIANQEVWSVAFSDNNSLLAAAVGQLDYWPRPNAFWEVFGAMQNASIQLWDITNKKLIDTLTGHTHIIESISFSPDGSILASASWDWTVKLWGDYPSITTKAQIDYWPTSSPGTQRVDLTLLNEICEDNSHILHSLVVIRHGKLVFEKYFGDSNHLYTKDSKHILFSATKSFTSTLVGIAIDKGFIRSVNQYVLDFFPEYNFSNVDSRKRNLTLKHLLTMTSGLTWHEEPSNDDLRRMYFNLDSVQYVLDKPMATEPGEYYRYNSGASHLLSAIIQKTTGKTTENFALQYLFKPLGIEESDIIWMADSNGNSYGGIGLFLTPRNMAKLGQLYLDKGLWKGKPVIGRQIIRNQWIAASSKDQIEGILFYGGASPVGIYSGYGYQWWISEDLNSYTAMGYQGQMIFVHPPKDLVIVLTARASLPLDYIIEGVIDTVLPEIDLSWLVFIIMPSLVFILFLFRKRINSVKVKIK